MRRSCTLSGSGEVIAVRGSVDTATVEIRLLVPVELANRHAWPGRRLMALLELLPSDYPERT